MKICVFDFETTGVDLEKDEPIELAYALYDSDLKSVINTQSFLIKTDLEITPQITELTGITKEMLDQYGVNYDVAYEDFSNANLFTDAYCAHYSDFDKAFLSKLARGSGFLDAKEDTDKMIFIDSANHIEFQFKTKKLTYLALEHGYVIQNAHRAINDVLALCHILKSYDMNEVYKTAIQKMYMVNVIIHNPFGGNGKITREALKDFGFKWDGEKYWQFKVKEDALDVVREFFNVNNMTNISPIIEELK